MAKRFDGQVAFITGASSGIGAAVALELAHEGARVALTARRADRLDEVRGKIETSGGTALAIACDVRDRASLDAAVAATIKAFGRIDLALANAGYGLIGSFASSDTQAFRDQFATNVFGVIDTVYAVLPHLIASKGRLGLVSSVAGRVGTPDTSAYSASKFAVFGLAESLYYELAAHGVSVTCIQPGFVVSEIRSLDAKGVYRPEIKDPFPAWLVVPAEDAARAIVAALYRRKFDAVITAHGKAAVWFSRHCPGILRAIIRRSTRGKTEPAER